MNFYEKFREAPTKDLIKIRDNPTLYQTEAVKAAIQILSTRVISDDDIFLAQQETAADDKLLNRESDFIRQWQQRVEGWLRYLITPSEKMDVKRWLIIFCIVLFIQYVFSVADHVKYFYRFYECDDCSFSAMDLLQLISIIYAPVIIPLLLLRSKWGWRLQVVSSWLAILSQSAFAIDSWFHDAFFDIPGTIAFALSVAFLWFFYKHEVRDFFNQTQKDFWQTTKVAFVIFIIGALYISFSE